VALDDPIAEWEHLVQLDIPGARPIMTEVIDHISVSPAANPRSPQTSDVQVSFR
jgi:hypothetical protein